MALFSRNKALKSRKGRHANTINRAGGQAFTLSPRHELLGLVTTSLVNDTFYSTSHADIQRLVRLVDDLAAKKDARFAAQAAIYARKAHGLRSITHALAALVAPKASGTPWARKFYEQVVYRPDDMSEILAFYWTHFGSDSAIPNAMKRGFASVLTKLDAYQLAKYRGGSRSVSLVDIVNLVHPKANEQLSALIKGELAPANTWEVALSAAGQEAKGVDQDPDELKAEAWARLLAEKKLPYFAALRNARNILLGAPKSIGQLVSLLTNRQAVKRSLVLPFQIAKGIKAVEAVTGRGARAVVEALHKALDLSLDNVPHLPGRTLVALDCSGSMQGRPMDIGSLFAAVLIKSQPEAELLVFSDNAEYLNIGTRGSVFSVAEDIKRRCVPAGTNFHAIFQQANRAYDRIILLSDMQAWIGHYAPTKAFTAYQRRYKTEPLVYTWDLQSYGTAQFPADSVVALSGWTDRVFDVMKAVESDPDALINEVASIGI